MSGPLELVDYTDADLPLSVALESDPVVMADLGGPRPLDQIERAHRGRIAGGAGGGGMWLKIVPQGAGGPIGALGVWRSEFEGEETWEVGWMLLAEFHGRGLGSEALGLLIERMRAEPRFELVHAFPGATNAASNGLCEKFGFQLQGESEVEFSGRQLRVNHWSLDVT